MSDSLWNAQQAAEYLGVKRSTIYEWAAHSVIPCVRLRKGRRRDCIRFRKSDLDQVIQSRTTAPEEKESWH